MQEYFAYYDWNQLSKANMSFIDRIQYGAQAAATQENNLLQNILLLWTKNLPPSHSVFHDCFKTFEMFGLAILCFWTFFLSRWLFRWVWLKPYSSIVLQFNVTDFCEDGGSSCRGSYCSPWPHGSGVVHSEYHRRYSKNFSFFILWKNFLKCTWYLVKEMDSLYRRSSMNRM